MVLDEVGRSVENLPREGRTLTKIQSVGLFQELPKSLWIDDPDDVKKIERML